MSTFNRKTEFTPPPQAANTRNSEVLESFVQYCKANPGQRFWQALLNWSGLPFIASVSCAPVYVRAEDEYGETVDVNDTYHWEGKNG